MKKRILVMLLALMMVPGSAKMESGDFDWVVQGQAAWIEARQIESGAILLYGDRDADPVVNPYFASYACLALLDAGHTRAVRRYLDWHVLRLNNTPDALGVLGTIYDYKVHGDGSDTPTLGYDSSDSYAALGLTLLRRYAEVDPSYVKGKRHAVDLMLTAIVATLEDGLTRCRADSRAVYLMDNCEVAQGLDSAAWMMREVFHDEERAVYLETFRDNVLGSIEARLWDEEAQGYRAELAQPVSWDRFYPEAACNLFPALTGVIDPLGERSRALAARFAQKHPEWAEGDADGHPWLALASTLAIAGEREAAEQAVKRAIVRYAPEYPYPWHVGEAAGAIQAALAISG